MNFLKQTWLVIFGLLGLIILFFTKCSDSKHLQKEIRDETIFLNQHISKVTKEPSTPQPVIKVVKKSLELEKLISERDTALQLTLKIKEKNQHLQLKELELQEKIKELLKNKNKNNTSIQTKLTASAAALLAANELTNNKNNEIQKLIQERDEATKASLEIEKKFQDLQSNSTQIKKDFQSEIEILQNSIKKDKEIAKNLLDEKQNQIDNLTNKLNHLEENLQDELHNKQSVEDKLEDIKEKDEKKLSQTSTELSELKKIISNKTEEINKLTQDKDKLTEEVNKLTQDKENIEQTLNKNNKKIENLLEEQNKTSISLQTKLAASVAALLAAKELTASKSDEVQKLLQEKDEAIKISLASDEANKDCKTKQSTLNQKIEELTTQKKQITITLKEAQKLTLSKSEELQKVKEQKSEAIKVTESFKAEKLKLNQKIEELQKVTLDKDIKIESLQKELKDTNSKTSKNTEALLQKIEEDKKLVLNQIIDTFKLSKVEFKTGSSILTQKSTQLLDTVAEIMKKHKGYHYKIQGHTDSSGKEKLNLALSKKRATSVKTYLISKGVDEQLLSSEGFGSSKPIADNKTKKGKIQNRRVVFEIVN